VVVVIATALTETLVKHMFKKYLDERDKIELGGAPSWYMVELDDKLCTFAHNKGGLDSVEIAKKDATIKMRKQIGKIVEVVIYDNMQNVKNEKEKAIVDKWKVDSNLPVFVDKHLDYSRIAYEDEVDTTFVRACIPRQIIFDYQKNRLEGIKSAVLAQKSSSAFGDLDDEFGDDDEGEGKDKFDF
jgi:hypothetical protein